MEKEQPNMAMIFNGKGMFLEKEKDMYHPDVDVYAQKKATADPEFCLKWANRTLKNHVKKNMKDKDFVLYADNLGSQKKKAFVKAVQGLKGEIAFGPPQKTEGWQPIDTGHIGATRSTK